MDHVSEGTQGEGIMGDPCLDNSHHPSEVKYYTVHHTGCMGTSTRICGDGTVSHGDTMDNRTCGERSRNDPYETCTQQYDQQCTDEQGREHYIHYCTNEQSPSNHRTNDHCTGDHCTNDHCTCYTDDNDKLIKNISFTSDQCGNGELIRDQYQSGQYITDQCAYDEAIREEPSDNQSINDLHRCDQSISDHHTVDQSITDPSTDDGSVDCTVNTHRVLRRIPSTRQKMDPSYGIQVDPVAVSRRCVSANPALCAVLTNVMTGPKLTPPATRYSRLSFTKQMSTPHPIKNRVQTDHSAQTRIPATDTLTEVNPTRTRTQHRLRRTRSAPDVTDGYVRRRRCAIYYRGVSGQAGDLAGDEPPVSSDDDPEESEEDVEIPVREEEEDAPPASTPVTTETLSIGSGSRQGRLEEMFEQRVPTYAEALWDHVTLDRDELGFCAGDVVEVTDTSSKDWWWGRVGQRQGWFPSTFVRLRVNQCDTADELSLLPDGSLDHQAAIRQYGRRGMVSREQARTNVVMEILQAERDYVKHLKDVVEGYLEKARKRAEMFPEERLQRIFCNIHQIQIFSGQFLRDVEKQVDITAPHMSELGQCFLTHKRGFEIYSVYCNNHPFACEELKDIHRDRSYLHFFEACRLLQNMIEIPLEGFLLTPVQKICKYPLQLRELLKYTLPEHPDYHPLQDALEAMKHIATLINERKRKMESLEKLAQWQDQVVDWQGPDILDHSSELILSGQLTKVNPSGWPQDRIFLLFDHQLIYCKKDLLWRDLLVYKGRIDMDHCEVCAVADGKEPTTNTNVKHAFKIYDRSKEKWYIVHGKSEEEKTRWLQAFEDERKRIALDLQNGFDLAEFRRQATGTYLKTHLEGKNKDKSKKKPKMGRYTRADYLNNLPAHATLPRSLYHQSSTHQPTNKRSNWFPFSKKTKR